MRKLLTSAVFASLGRIVFAGVVNIVAPHPRDSSMPYCFVGSC